MKEQVSELAFLEKKFRDEIELLEHQLMEAKRRLTVVSEAIELLKKEGIFDQEKLFEVSPILSDRHKDMSLTEAIRDILESASFKKLSAEEIYLELQKHGFKSNSRDPKRDVYTRLWRLRKGGKLFLTKEKGIKKYSLPKKEEEKITEKTN